MKVFCLTHYELVDRDIVQEWFRNLPQAQKRRSELLDSYKSLPISQREDLEYRLSQPRKVLIPEKKDALIRWLNNHVCGR